MQQHRVNSARGRWILVATILVSGMAAFLGRSVSLALPAIQAALQTNIGGIQWVLNSYGVIMAVLIFTSGSLGDHFGRKRVFVYGIGVFVIGSVLSAFSQTIGQLIIFQGLLGVGAVMMLPACLSIINACFIESEKGRAIGHWAGLGGAFGAAGLLLGGWIIQAWGWRAIYLVNVPIGLLTLFITLRAVPESRNPLSTRIDWIATGWLALGLLGASYGLIHGPLAGWRSTSVVLSLLGGVGGVLLFLFSQVRSPAPLIPLSVFHNPVVAGANLVTFFLYFTLNGVYVFLVVHFQQLYGYSPAAAGAGMLPPTLLVTLFAGPSGSVTDRVGPRIPLIVGSTLTAIGIALLMIPGVDATYVRHFLPGLIVLGAGMVVFVAPITKSALAVDARYSGVASGLNNAVARISGLMAIAILGAVMVSTFTGRLHQKIRASTLSREQQAHILGQASRVWGVEAPDSFGEAARAQTNEAVQASLIYAFRWAMGINAGLAFLSAMIAAVTLRSPGTTSS